MILLDHCVTLLQSVNARVCVRVTENKSLDSSYSSAGCRSIVPVGKVSEHHYRLVEIITDYLAHTHVRTDTHSLSDKKTPISALFLLLLLRALAYILSCGTEFSEIFNSKDVNQSI